MADSKTTPPAPEPMCGGTTGFILIFITMFVVLIMFDTTLRNAMTGGMNYVLYPAMGFGGQYPMMTLFLASCLMVTISTVIRHFMTDWVEMARIQKHTSSFNKEYRDAMLGGNMAKANKLKEHQPRIMEMNSKMMIANLKPMVVTILVAILIFGWLWRFFDDLSPAYVALPWKPNWNASYYMCFTFQYWILLYTLFSIPIGQVLARALKVYSYSKMVAKVEANQMGRAQTAIGDADRQVAEARSKGVPDARARELLSKARSQAAAGDHSGAERSSKEALEELDRSRTTHDKMQELIAQAQGQVDTAAKKGIGVEKAESSLMRAREASRSGDSSSAIFFAKQAQRQVKEAKERHLDAEGSISALKSTMFDLKDIRSDEAERHLKEAAALMARHDYDGAMAAVKKGKRAAEDTVKSHKEATRLISDAEHTLNEARLLGADTRQSEEHLIHAKYAFQQGKFQDAVSNAREALDGAKGVQNQHRDAQDAINFAQLVISNAEGFGADVSGPAGKLAEAKGAIERRDYALAIKRANEAKAQAEEIKRNVQRTSRRG